MCGAVAVKNGCQIVLPLGPDPRSGAPVARQHVVNRRACTDALTANLQRASFPLSLLPATPFALDRKEPRR